MGYHITSSARLGGLTGFANAMAVQRRIGSADDSGYRTPLFGDTDPLTVASKWKRRIVSKSFADLEIVEAKKVGPYFNRPFDEWSSNLGNYYVHEPHDYDNKWWENDPDMRDAMIEEITALTKLTKRKIRPLSILEGFRISRKGTNLGFPYVTSTWSEQVIGHYLRRAQLLLEGKDPTLYPFIMFKRVQPGGPDREMAKQRPVWGSDHAETFAGISVLNPLLRVLSFSQEFSHLLGIDKLELVLKGILPRAPWKFSLDLGQADATFGPKWLLLGLEIMSQLVELDDRYLRSVFNYYSNGDLLTPNGIYKGIHGLPSGVAFTNILEIFGFRTMARYAFKKMNIKCTHYFQNGDDGLYLTSEPFEPTDMAEIYQRYGLVVNPDKSGMSSDDASYLQRHFRRIHDYQAVMSTNRMLGRILYSERGVDVAKVGMSVRDYWTLNTIMKLENCKRHPDFHKFVDFVRAGDVGGLDPSPILGRDPADAEGYSPFGDGVYGNSGLLDFETVKYLIRGNRKFRGLQSAGNRPRT